MLTASLRVQVDYRLGFLMENPVAMDQPRSNISTQGEVPRVPSGLSNTDLLVLVDPRIPHAFNMGF